MLGPGASATLHVQLKVHGEPLQSLTFCAFGLPVCVQCSLGSSSFRRCAPLTPTSWQDTVCKKKCSMSSPIFNATKRWTQETRSRTLKYTNPVTDKWPHCLLDPLFSYTNFAARFRTMAALFVLDFLVLDPSSLFFNRGTHLFIFTGPPTPQGIWACVLVVASGH